MNRITRRYQSESLKDRSVLAHNASLNRVLPDKFGYEERPYVPGTIYKFLGGMAVKPLPARAPRLQILFQKTP